MVGGNIKSLLPAPSTLSIPSVAEGGETSVRMPGATPPGRRHDRDWSPGRSRSIVTASGRSREAP